MNGLSPARILAVLDKEFTQLRRDRLTYAMILVLPIIQLLLFGYAINDLPRHLPTAVLDQDRSVYSRSVLTAAANTGFFRFVREIGSPKEGARLLRRGEVQFVISIPDGFEARAALGRGAQILVEGDASDPSATAGGEAALTALQATALSRNLRALPGGRADPAPPFEVVVHNLYNPEAVTSVNIVPGLLAVILSMTLVVMTALSMTREAERGTMEFLLSTPARPPEVMAGKLGPYVMVGLAQTAVFLVAARLLFRVPMAGGWAELALGVLLFIVGSLSLGFLISTLARSQLQAMQMAIFYIMPSILLSGFMFPFRGMPVWAQAVGSALPVTYFLRIVRGALLKGQGLADAWPNLGALALFVAVVTILAMLRYRRTLD